MRRFPGVVRSHIFQGKLQLENFHFRIELPEAITETPDGAGE
jgi:hypothetical protein